MALPSLGGIAKGAVKLPLAPFVGGAKALYGAGKGAVMSSLASNPGAGAAQAWMQQSAEFMKGSGGKGGDGNGKETAAANIVQSNMDGAGQIVAGLKGIEKVLNKMGFLLQEIKTDTQLLNQTMISMLKTMVKGRPDPYEKARAKLKPLKSLSKPLFKKPEEEEKESEKGGLLSMLAAPFGLLKTIGMGIVGWFTKPGVWKKIFTLVGLTLIGVYIKGLLEEKLGKPLSEANLGEIFTAIKEVWHDNFIDEKSWFKKGIEGMKVFFAAWKKDGPIAALTTLFTKGDDELSESKGKGEGGGWSWGAIAIGLGALTLFLSAFVGLKVAAIIAGITALSLLEGKVGGMMKAIGDKLGIDTSEWDKKAIGEEGLETAGQAALGTDARKWFGTPGAGKHEQWKAAEVEKRATKGVARNRAGQWQETGGRRRFVDMDKRRAAAQKIVDKKMQGVKRIKQLGKWASKTPGIKSIVTPYLLWKLVSDGFEQGRSPKEMVPDIAGLFGGITGATLGGTMGAIVGAPGGWTALLGGAVGAGIGAFFGDRMATGLAQWAMGLPVTAFDPYKTDMELATTYGDPTHDKPAPAQSTELVPLPEGATEQGFFNPRRGRDVGIDPRIGAGELTGTLKPLSQNLAIPAPDNSQNGVTVIAPTNVSVGDTNAVVSPNAKQQPPQLAGGSPWDARWGKMSRYAYPGR